MNPFANLFPSKEVRELNRRREDHEWLCDLVLTWHFTRIKEEAFLAFLESKYGETRYSMTPEKLNVLASEWCTAVSYRADPNI